MRDTEDLQARSGMVRACWITVGVTAMAIELVAYGKPQDMVAEFSAFDLNRECKMMWRYYAMPIGDEHYDTEGFMTIADCRAWALDMRRHYGCKITRI